MKKWSPRVELEVDDDRMIALVRQTSLTQKQRKELWSGRYRSNILLRREFPKERTYTAFMESLLTGRVKLKK